MNSGKTLNIDVIKGRVLGVDVLRGYAKLSDLSRISRPDIYDQKNNPMGTQRDLNPRHAKKAYEYVETKDLAFWPEVFLCVRERDVISFSPLSNNNAYGVLKINISKIDKSKGICISRIDGNHRLHFASGEHSGFSAIDRTVSFCIAYELTLSQEISLFRDINDNQRRMNTSHLDNIQARLAKENTLKAEDTPLFIAEKLSHDPDSPFYNRVYEGGRRIPGFDIPLRTLKTGIQYMLSRPTKLTALKDPIAQYRVIKNYFIAVKKWQPNAWIERRKYLLLRGAVLWGICFIGADVIDRALTKGKFKAEDMLKILKSGRDWNWTNKGDFTGLSGRGGAAKIRDMVTAEFQEEGGISVRELYERIMQD